MLVGLSADSAEDCMVAFVDGVRMGRDGVWGWPAVLRESTLQGMDFITEDDGQRMSEMRQALYGPGLLAVTPEGHNKTHVIDDSPIMKGDLPNVMSPVATAVVSTHLLYIGLDIRHPRHHALLFALMATFVEVEGRHHLFVVSLGCTGPRHLVPHCQAQAPGHRCTVGMSLESPSRWSKHDRFHQ